MLCDADVGGGGLVLLRREEAGYTLATEGGEIPFTAPVEYPVVRRVRPGLILVVGVRTGGEPNAHLVTDRGEVVRSFFVGDGIADVMVCGPRIVVTYFDEGVFGDFAVGQKGLAVFDTRGELLWGHNSDPGGRGVAIDDCYCACTDGEDRVWFTPYMKFPLVELDVERRAQKVSPLPSELHRSSAITTDGRIFHFAKPDRWGHTSARNQISRWNPASGEIVRVGEVDGKLRGLPNGRFISVRPDGHEIISPPR